MSASDNPGNSRAQARKRQSQPEATLSPSTSSKLISLHRQLGGLGVAEAFWQGLDRDEQRQLVRAARAREQHRDGGSAGGAAAASQDGELLHCYQALGGPIGMYVALRGISEQAAVLNLAEQMQLISSRKADRLRHQIEVQQQLPMPPNSLTPEWERAAGELRFGGSLLCRVAIRKDSRLIPLLDAFQAAGWPSVMASPDQDAERTRQTVHRLERKLPKPGPVTFHVNGEYVTWRPTSTRP